MLLALLLKLSRSRKRHVMICHGKVISPWSIRFMKLFRLSGQIDRFVCYGPRVAEILQRKMPSVSSKVSVVYHAADQEFWKPQGIEPERLISAAGMFYRDYPTLIEAVRDLDVSLHVAGFSPWMARNHDGAATPDVPANVTFGRMTQAQLRDLYARSLFVALPLTEVNSQAGSLVIYEAMATGKAVVVTNTRGQEELRIVDEGVTGLYVKPGDVQEWRTVITRFLENPSEAIDMGSRAREIVERGLNMDRWAEELAEIVRSVAPAGK
jgi:glycosyltransferase involved in cell wall biosynthesis